MTDKQETVKSHKGTMNPKKTILISFLILLAGGVITVIIFSTEPKAVRQGATKETAMLVEVTKAQKGSFHPTITTMGTVEPSQNITLSPRVSGEIIKRSGSFTPGGYARKGETLLHIDPADYRNTLTQRKSELRQAEADLKIEMGRQNVALKDYQLLNETLSQEQEALILRKPQLNAARSQVEAARAAVDQARLNLERTTIKAPFNARILSRNVNIGSQVARGDNLGRLVGLDTYWVAATVPLSRLQWLTFPEDGDKKGSKVKIHNKSAWPEGTYRMGTLYKMVGTLEDQTRMARILISVPDPLAHRTDSADVPPLIIGSYVEADIQASEIADVIRLNRNLIRKNETVWVMKDEKLRIRDVNIVFRDNKYAYISNGVEENAQVVTTNLSTVADGARLRVASDTKASQKQDTLAGRER